MTKITDAQRALLQAAIDNPDATLDAARAKIAKALIKAGLAISVPLAEGGSRLMVTEAGRAALGLEPAAQPSRDEPPPPAATAAVTPKGKLGVMAQLLRRPEGATVEAMSAATGWQHHSVRGAMAGALKKKLGLSIATEKTEGGRVYRIVAGEAK